MLPIASMPPPDVVFIRTAVTFDAAVKPPDTFLDMLAAYIGWRMFMAAVAGIAPVIIAYVAGGAAGVVITVQHEIFIMFKACRRPFL